MHFNKKSQYSNLSKIILVLIVGVLLLTLIPIILKGGSRAADITACRNWVVLQGVASKIPTADLSNPCVTFQDKLEGKEYEVYETLARGMYDTWKMYGEGRVDFFSNWNWFNKETYCFIGDEISIDKKLTTSSIDINNFEEYLSSYNPPKNEQTYAEFFTGVENTKLDFGMDKINLKEDEKIYIIFTIKKGRGFFNTGENWKSIGVGCSTGVAIGSIIPGVGNIVAGGIGCVAGFVTSQIGRATDTFPGLILISGEDISSLRNKCNGGLHYKPKENILKK